MLTSKNSMEYTLYIVWYEILYSILNIAHNYLFSAAQYTLYSAYCFTATAHFVLLQTQQSVTIC